MSKFESKIHFDLEIWPWPYVKFMVKYVIKCQSRCSDYHTKFEDKQEKMLSCYLELKFSRFNFSVADARWLKGIAATWAPGAVVKFLS